MLRRRLLSPALYLPGVFLVGLRCRRWSAGRRPERLQHRLDQTDYAYLARYYVVAAVVFWVQYHREQQPLQRQQLKWLSRGTLLTVLPFTVLYVIPFLLMPTVPKLLTRSRCSA